jgi:hypothetical protein
VRLTDWIRRAASLTDIVEDVVPDGDNNGPGGNSKAPPIDQPDFSYEVDLEDTKPDRGLGRYNFPIIDPNGPSYYTDTKWRPKFFTNFWQYRGSAKPRMTLSSLVRGSK